MLKHMLLIILKTMLQSVFQNLWGDSLKPILEILNQSLPRPLSRVLTILFGGDRTEWRGSFLSWIPHNFVILKQDRKLPRRTPYIPYTKLSDPLNSDSINYPVYYSVSGSYSDIGMCFERRVRQRPRQ